MIEALEQRIAPASASFNLGLLTEDTGFPFPTADNLRAIGDINGDGFDDVISSELNVGTNVLLGAPRGFTKPYPADGIHTFALYGDPDDDDGLYSVSGVGDVNHDGFDDIAVAAEYASPDGLFFAGSAYIVFGRETPFPPSVHLPSLNGTDGFRINGATRLATAGWTQGVGDVNADGFADFVVITGRGAFWNETNSAYVVFGKSSFPAVVTLTGFDGNEGFVLQHNVVNGAFRTVANVGDVNNDGFDDILLGCPRPHFSGSVPLPGKAFLVFGRNQFAPTIDVMGLDGDSGVVITAGEDADYFGGSLSGGDINRDGFADIVVGADLSSPGGKLYAGSSYVIFGASDFSGTIDVTQLDWNNGFVINGPHSLDRLGGDVDLAGDINQDGIDDLVITASENIYFAADRPGAVYVIFGSENPFPPVFDVEHLDGTNGFRVTSGKTDLRDVRLGFEVASGGDVNGDGADDLLIVGRKYGDGHDLAWGLFGGPTIGVLPPVVPSISEDGRHATFRDIDGDEIVVDISGGHLSAEDFVITPSGEFDGGTFALLNLSGATNSFHGANLSVKAFPTSQGGNGRVNLGYLNATGIDLGAVFIGGDLGRIDVGSPTSPEAAITTLKVQSMGRYGLLTQDGISAQLESHIAGDVGYSIQKSLDGTLRPKGGLKIAGSIQGITISVTGDVTRVNLGGDMRDSTLEILGMTERINNSLLPSLSEFRTVGSVERSSILLGYDSLKQPVNPDVQVGTIRVKGDWVTSDLAVGVRAGSDNRFGTDDDDLIRTVPAPVAALESLIVRGEIFGSAATGDHYGLVAEEIGRFKSGGLVTHFTPGPSNDLVGTPLGITSDVVIKEVRRLVI